MRLVLGETSVRVNVNKASSAIRGLHALLTTPPRRRRAGASSSSPTRLVAHIVAWLSVLVVGWAILRDHSALAGVAGFVGLVVYVALRLLRPILDRRWSDS